MKYPVEGGLDPCVKEGKISKEKSLMIWEGANADALMCSGVKGKRRGEGDLRPLRYSARSMPFLLHHADTWISARSHPGETGREPPRARTLEGVDDHRCPRGG